MNNLILYTVGALYVICIWITVIIFCGSVVVTAIGLHYRFKVHELFKAKGYKEIDSDEFKLLAIKRDRWMALAFKTYLLFAFAVILLIGFSLVWAPYMDRFNELVHG